MGKSRLSFKTTAKLSSGRGRLATRVITIFLSAFSFILFAIASMGFTYNETNYLARAYCNYCAERSYVAFTKGGDFGSSTISEEEVERCSEETGLSFAYCLGTLVCDYWGKYVADSKGETIFNDWANDERNRGGSGALAGSEEDYEGMGFTLLAGRYPAAENEIAISEAHYEAFHLNGYYDASKNFVWTALGMNGNQVAEVFVYSGTVAGNITGINNYPDILGKTIGKGDVETEEHAFAYKIVGVVDTCYDQKFADGDEDYEYPSGRFLFSQDWKHNAKRIYSGKIEDLKAMKKCVKFSLSSIEENGEEQALMLTKLNKLTSVVTDEGYTDKQIFMFICIAAGGGSSQFLPLY